MKRILIAVDDYSEFAYLHVRFKKLGFDVEGAQKQIQFDQFLLSFNPELIIASTREVNIFGFKIASQITKNSSQLPKLILLKNKDRSYAEKAFQHPEIDKVVESPIKMHEMIEALSQLFNLNQDRLLEKYEKIFKKIDEEEGREVLVKDARLSPPPPLVSDLSSSLSTKDRQSRFQKFIDQKGDFKMETLSTQKISNYVKNLRSQPRTQQLENLDEKRMAFVKALFNP